jgi:glycosyltransferase involved in cell wall biosynthesis
MVRPLRVLHVIESLEHGGAEVSLASMITRLPSAEFEQHVAWLDPHDTLRPLIEPHCTSMIAPPAPQRLAMPRAVARLAGWMRAHRPDVVHAQLVRAQLVARVAALAAGDVPVVTTWQNASYEPFSLGDFSGSRRKQQLVRAVDMLSGLRDRRFIAVSEYVAQHLGRALRVPRRRIEVIYNAVDPARFAPVGDAALAALRTELGLDERAEILLNLGRLVPQKAQHLLIDAMPAVVAARPRAVLLVAGGGPLKETLESQIATRGVGDRVRLLGPRGDATALLQLAQLFVLPSLYEGLSVALVEACANGLPAVVADIAQNREVAAGSPAVRLSPVGDAAGLARAIVEQLEARAGLAAAAAALRDDVRRRFDAAMLAGRLGAALRSAAAADV